MSQDYQLPVGTDNVAVAIKNRTVNCLEAVRSNFSGGTEPTERAPFQFWADDSAGLLKIRNAANTAWVVVAPLAAATLLSIPFKSSGALAAAEYQIAVPQKASIQKVVLVPDTATTGSVASTTEWAFMLRNVTEGQDLFSATPTTATSQSGIGGGELAADTAYVLNADQNQTLTQHDVLRFTVTQTGSPTAVSDASIVVAMAVA